MPRRIFKAIAICSLPTLAVSIVWVCTHLFTYTDDCYELKCTISNLSEFSRSLHTIGPEKLKPVNTLEEFIQLMETERLVSNPRGGLINRLGNPYRYENILSENRRVIKLWSSEPFPKFIGKPMIEIVIKGNAMTITNHWKTNYTWFEETFNR